MSEFKDFKTKINERICFLIEEIAFLKKAISDFNLIKVKTGDIAYHPKYGTCLVGNFDFKHRILPFKAEISEQQEFLVKIIIASNSEQGRGFTELEVNPLELLPFKDMTEILYQG